MLSRVLAVIRDAGRPMCLSDLSAVVGVDETALEGMLETLVALGRLRALALDGPSCTACPFKGGCFVMEDGVATSYVLAPDPAVVRRAVAAPG